MIKLSGSLKRQILAHAAAACPQESCGLLLSANGQTVYRPCTNTAADPCRNFEISPAQWAAAEDAGEVLAVVHAHPDGQPFLSAADRAAQLANPLPWLLAVAGSLKTVRPVPRLLGRVFEYGRADCMALLRDAYHLAGIELPDPPRGDFNADAKANRFILEGVRHGFNQVRQSDMAAGDAVLMSCGGEANHVGLYLGGGMMLHHAAGSLSRRDLLGGYWLQSLHSVWRHQNWRPEMMTAVKNDFAP